MWASSCGHAESCARTGRRFSVASCRSCPAGAPPEPCGRRWLADGSAPARSSMLRLRGAAWRARSRDSLCDHRRVVGRSPSQNFDPAFYLERTRMAPGMSPTGPLHRVWRSEGRRRSRHQQVGVSASAGRPASNVLVLSRGLAWRTGARLEYARRLASSYNVVSVLMGGGALERAFAAVSAATVGPMAGGMASGEYEARRGAPFPRIQAALCHCQQHRNAALVPALSSASRWWARLWFDRDECVTCWIGRRMSCIPHLSRNPRTAFPAFARRQGVHLLSQGCVGFRTTLPQGRPIRTLEARSGQPGAT